MTKIQLQCVGVAAFIVSRLALGGYTDTRGFQPLFGTGDMSVIKARLQYGVEGVHDVLISMGIDVSAWAKSFSASGGKIYLSPCHTDLWAVSNHHDAVDAIMGISRTDANGAPGALDFLCPRSPHIARMFARNHQLSHASPIVGGSIVVNSNAELAKSWLRRIELYAAKRMERNKPHLMSIILIAELKWMLHVIESGLDDRDLVAKMNFFKAWVKCSFTHVMRRVTTLLCSWH